MKITSFSKSAERGTALLVALFLCLILSISIAGYMKHAQQQNRFSVRSQSWNLSVAVSEAGVEEALQQLNSNTGDLTTDGWAKNGSVYRVTRNLNSTTRYTVYLDMASPSAPVITSQSFIDTPSLAMLNSVPSTMFAAQNLNVGINNTVSRAVRVRAGRSGLFLKAMVAKHLIDMNGNNVLTDSFNSTSPTNSNNGRYPAGDHTKLLNNGDVASNDSVANTVNVGNANIYGRVSVGPGGGISVGTQGGVGTYNWQLSHLGSIQDGYFTDDMNFTFPKVELPYNVGLTPQPKTITTTTYTNSVQTDLVTTNIYPNPVPPTGVQTNTSYTTVSAQPNPVPNGLVTNVLTVLVTNNTSPDRSTYIGTATKINGGGNSGGWAYNNITGTNYTYPIVTYTYWKTTTTPVAVITTTDYDYYIIGASGNMPPLDFYVSSLPGGNIFVKGNARLVVAGDLDVAGNKPANQITLDTDAKLEMWVGGTSCKLSGNGVINPTGFAQNFICWCTDSVTDVSLNGNGEFIGVLVAPNGNVRLNGGGKASEDFIGSLLANSITLNGHFNFHYDEALRSYNGAGRFTIQEWNEIPISQVNQ